MIKTFAGIFAALAALGTAQAEDLGPMQARSIALGEVSGVAYYTVSEGGYELVATVAASDDSTPVRFVATLAAGQQIILSVPRAENEKPIELVFARLGDSVIVSGGADNLAMN